MGILKTSKYKSFYFITKKESFRSLSLALFFGFIVMTFTGCEIPLTRKNIRSPHLPVFAEITPKQQSASNPYWVRFTSVDDNPEIRLSDNSLFKPDRPTLFGTLGTHFRFRNNIYTYAMTDGIGIQYDSYFTENAKSGIGAFVGINNTGGVQLFFAKKITEFYNADLTFYTSLQGRYGYQLIACEKEENEYCIPSNPSVSNRMRSRHEARDLLFGLQWGDIKMGDVGNTTLNFKIELGYNQISFSSIDFENHPSQFTQDKDNFIFSFQTGVTLF